MQHNDFLFYHAIGDAVKGTGEICVVCYLSVFIPRGFCTKNRNMSNQNSLPFSGRLSEWTSNQNPEDSSTFRTPETDWATLPGTKGLQRPAYSRVSKYPRIPPLRHSFR